MHLLAFNDLHGNLEAGGNNIYGQFAGGAAYLAKAIKDRQAQYGQYQATVFAGDNIGASPLANGLFHEEPITIASNLMSVDFASVGNHEFDKGSAELLRIQNGGCHADGCTAAPYALNERWQHDHVYPGADFQYLSANVVRSATGETLFPAYGIKRFTSTDGKKFQVGFIGEVLESTPTIVTPDGRCRADVPGRGRCGEPCGGRARRPRCEGPCARHPPGRLPVRERGAQRLRRQSGRQRHRRDRCAPRSGDQGDHLRSHTRRVPLHDHHRTA